jgi:hypothetical protein
VLQHLHEVGKPVALADLTTLLQRYGLLASTCGQRYVSKALAVFRNDILYLHKHGYWLKHQARR